MAEPSGLFRALMGDPLEDQHYAAIGRFVVAYADAEAAAHVALRHHCGLPEAIGRVLIGGQRISDISDKFRKIITETNNSKLIKDVDDLLTQFSIISNERARMVHRQSQYNGEIGFIVSNAKTAKSLIAPEIDVYSQVSIREMVTDCKRISVRFQLQTIPEFQIDDRDFVWLFEPWLYKPPSRGKKSHKNLGAA